MANFVTDTDLQAAAFGLAHSMLQMLDRNGVGPDVVGLPDQMDVDVFRRSIETDAELYMSMSPAHLAAEYDEIRTAAGANGPSSDRRGIVDAAMIDLEANWSGDAADAYFNQLRLVRERINTQHEYMLVAAAAVSMMYAVSVTFRASCHDLMMQTATVCDAIADELAPQPTNWAKVIVDLVGKAIDAVTNPRDIAGMAIDGVLNQVGQSTEKEPVAGAEALPVVNGYTAARDRLFESYEDSLGRINEWLDSRRREYADLDVTLPEPLPNYADVNSPDFRYEKFLYDDEPSDLGPEVERERQRYLDEKTKPDGVIAQKLAGDR